MNASEWPYWLQYPQPTFWDEARNSLSSGEVYCFDLAGGTRVQGRVMHFGTKSIGVQPLSGGAFTRVNVEHIAAIRPINSAGERDA